MNHNFAVNQIVAGRVGQFVILGFRMIGGEQHAQVKAYDPITKTVAAGELALPVSILREVA